MNITTTEDQTIFDLAIMMYGTLDAVFKIMDDNPQLVFDQRKRNTDSIDNDSQYIFDDNFRYFCIPLVSGQNVTGNRDEFDTNYNVIENLETSVLTTGHAKLIE